MITFFQNSPAAASLIFSIVINMFFFLFAASFRTDKVTDLSYSLSFFLLAPLLLLAGGPSVSILQRVITAAIMLWGLRLGSYLLYRILKIGKDDRFDDKRNTPRVFIQFWILQILAVWIIMLPFSLFLTARPALENRTAAAAGILVYLAGLIIESVSDIQKFRFRQTPANRGHWMDRGLWKYSRHPNYFGEIMVWWGLFLAAAPHLRGLEWITLLGPVSITVLLLFVSGIPLLEKGADEKYGANPEYREYRRTTSLLIPLPRKRKEKR